MKRTVLPNRRFLTALLIALMAGSLGASAYGKQKIKVIKEKPKKVKPQAKPTDVNGAAEPDKILYQRALNSMKRSKYTEARLELQTLINTYPDSEYLAKAKLAIADSFYKQGGVGDLTQAIDAYKSFVVFFPFLDEAQYAQMQVAMCHYRMMLKSDRDPTEAESAEAEFQNFLLKYPQSALIPKAEQDLRNVQEIIADGEFRIGRFYYLKPDYPAAAARLTEVAERYPLYSQSDDALWMLGNIYMLDRKYTKDEDLKNKWADDAGKCYSRILRDYPLSSHAGDAKAKLKSMGMRIPSADPHAMARMEQDQRFENKHHEFFAIRWPKEILLSRPDTSDASRVGQPNLNPPSDTISATDIFKRDAPGPVFTAAAAPAAATAGNADNSSADAVPINAEPQSEVEDTPDTSVGAQIISSGPGDSNTTSQSTPAANSAPASAAPAAAPASAAPSMLSAVGSDSNKGAVANSESPSAGQSNSASPAQSIAPKPASEASTSSATTPPQPQTAPAADGASPPAAKAKASKSNPKAESTSKKKHGLHKIVPW